MTQPCLFLPKDPSADDVVDSSPKKKDFLLCKAKLFLKGSTNLWIKLHQHSQSYCCICPAPNTQSYLLIRLLHGAPEGMAHLHQYQNPTLNSWSEIYFKDAGAAHLADVEPQFFGNNYGKIGTLPLVKVTSTKEKRNVRYELVMR